MYVHPLLVWILLLLICDHKKNPLWVLNLTNANRFQVYRFSAHQLEGLAVPCRQLHKRVFRVTSVSRTTILAPEQPKVHPPCSCPRSGKTCHLFFHDLVSDLFCFVRVILYCIGVLVILCCVGDFVSVWVILFLGG